MKNKKKEDSTTSEPEPSNDNTEQTLNDKDLKPMNNSDMQKGVSVPGDIEVDVKNQKVKEKGQASAEATDIGDITVVPDPKTVEVQNTVASLEQQVQVFQKITDDERDEYLEQLSPLPNSNTIWNSSSFAIPRLIPPENSMTLYSPDFSIKDRLGRSLTSPTRRNSVVFFRVPDTMMFTATTADDCIQDLYRIGYEILVKYVFTRVGPVSRQSNDMTFGFKHVDLSTIKNPLPVLDPTRLDVPEEALNILDGYRTNLGGTAVELDQFDVAYQSHLDLSVQNPVLGAFPANGGLNANSSGIRTARSFIMPVSSFDAGLHRLGTNSFALSITNDPYSLEAYIMSAGIEFLRVSVGEYASFIDYWYKISIESRLAYEMLLGNESYIRILKDRLYTYLSKVITISEKDSVSGFHDYLRQAATTLTAVGEDITNYISTLRADSRKQWLLLIVHGLIHNSTRITFSIRDTSKYDLDTFRAWITAVCTVLRVDSVEAETRKIMTAYFLSYVCAVPTVTFRNGLANTTFPYGTINDRDWRSQFGQPFNRAIDGGPNGGTWSYFWTTFWSGNFVIPNTQIFTANRQQGLSDLCGMPRSNWRNLDDLALARRFFSLDRTIFTINALNVIDAIVIFCFGGCDSALGDFPIAHVAPVNSEPAPSSNWRLSTGGQPYSWWPSDLRMAQKSSSGARLFNTWKTGIQIILASLSNLKKERSNRSVSRSRVFLENMISDGERFDSIVRAYNMCMQLAIHKPEIPNINNATSMAISNRVDIDIDLTAMGSLEVMLDFNKMSVAHESTLLESMMGGAQLVNECAVMVSYFIWADTLRRAPADIPNPVGAAFPDLAPMLQLSSAEVAKLRFKDILKMTCDKFSSIKISPNEWYRIMESNSNDFYPFSLYSRNPLIALFSGQPTNYKDGILRSSFCTICQYSISLPLALPGIANIATGFTLNFSQAMYELLDDDAPVHPIIDERTLINEIPLGIMGDSGMTWNGDVDYLLNLEQDNQPAELLLNRSDLYTTIRAFNDHAIGRDDYVRSRPFVGIISKELWRYALHSDQALSIIKATRETMSVIWMVKDICRWEFYPVNERNDDLSLLNLVDPTPRSIQVVKRALFGRSNMRTFNDNPPHFPMVCPVITTTLAENENPLPNELYLSYLAPSGVINSDDSNVITRPHTVFSNNPRPSRILHNNAYQTTGEICAMSQINSVDAFSLQTSVGLRTDLY
jgi:hypothetical protein